jgi:hypothetical protein
MLDVEIELYFPNIPGFDFFILFLLPIKKKKEGCRESRELEVYHHGKSVMEKGDGNPTPYFILREETPKELNIKLNKHKIYQYNFKYLVY